MRLVLKCSSLFRAFGSVFSNALVPFEQFAPCSQIPWSLSSGRLLVLKFSTIFLGLLLVFNFSTLFRAVCSLSHSAFRADCALFSNFLVSFERFAPCSPILYSLSSSLLPVLLKFPSPFPTVCALFSNSLVSFERSTPCSQTLYSLSIGLPPVLKFPKPFRTVCASQVP